MQALGAILTVLSDGLRSGSPHATGDQVLERVTAQVWLTGFPVGGSILTADQEHRLSILAGAFYLVPHAGIAVPAQDPDPAVTRLVGHASRTGSEELNRQLGLERAKSVRQRLLTMGVDGSLLPPPETMGSQGNPPTPIALTPEDMALGAELPEHRATEIVFEKTIARRRLDTVDWVEVVQGVSVSPSRARDFWYSYGTYIDSTLGSMSFVLEVLSMLPVGASIVATAGAGATVATVAGAVLVPVGAIMGFVEGLDDVIKTYRLYAAAFQAADWVMQRDFCLSQGSIPYPDQPERYWKTKDIADEYADDRDREAARERRQHWRDGADIMQAKLREAIQVQYDLIRGRMDPPRAAELEIEHVEQALRYAIRRNASNDPDRLGTGQEVLDAIYPPLRAEAGVLGVRTSLIYPSANFR